VYYRLHQFDYDGESAYSDVRVVELDNLEGVTVNVYPNPAREAIYVRVDAETEEELKIELVNVNGQKLYSNTLTSKESNTRLDLSKYQAGIYFVTVKSAKSNYFYKIVKQ
ncbi:MAG: T9SS type A sorting domain-containing protein, partial [Bacteroidia bacterium]